MGQLLFKKVFWDAIRGGSKRTTIRRWAAPRVKPGQRAWAPGVGWLAIESVETLDRLDHLTDADARADGFDSAASMLAALKAMYPHARHDGRAWFRVAFRWEQAAPTPDADADADGESGAKRSSSPLLATAAPRSRVPKRAEGATGASGADGASHSDGANRASARAAARVVAAALKDAIARKSSASPTSSSPPPKDPEPSSRPASLTSPRPAAPAPRRKLTRAEPSRAARDSRTARGSGPSLFE